MGRASKRLYQGQFLLPLPLHFPLPFPLPLPLPFPLPLLPLLPLLLLELLLLELLLLLLELEPLLLLVLPLPLPVLPLPLPVLPLVLPVLPLVLLRVYDLGMAWRIADLVVDGELDNTVKGRVTGWLRLAGREERVRLELLGNCRPDLAGWRFRIVRLAPIPAWAEPVDLDGFATEQIGEAGDILADQLLRHYDCPVGELLARIRAGEPPPTDLRPALYLEWYSDRNGRVVIQDTRLGVERLGLRTFELTADDLRRENEDGERRLDETFLVLDPARRRSSAAAPSSPPRGFLRARASWMPPLPYGRTR